MFTCMLTCKYEKEVSILQEKTIAIRIDEGLHKKIKLKLAENGLTLKDYIIKLIEKDLNENSLNWETIPLDNSVDEKTVKEAQKVLDFVSGVINRKK